MIRFGKPVTSDDFRTDRYFEYLLGNFYAMPKDNYFKYEKLGGQIENLYILPDTRTNPAILTGLVLGSLASIINPVLGVLNGMVAAASFASTDRVVVVQFADGRCLSIWADKTKLEYLKKKSNNVQYL